MSFTNLGSQIAFIFWREHLWPEISSLGVIIHYLKPLDSANEDSCDLSMCNEHLSSFFFFLWKDWEKMTGVKTASLWKPMAPRKLHELSQIQSKGLDGM